MISPTVVAAPRVLLRQCLASSSLVRAFLAAREGWCGNPSHGKLPTLGREQSINVSPVPLEDGIRETGHEAGGIEGVGLPPASLCIKCRDDVHANTQTGPLG